MLLKFLPLIFLLNTVEAKTFINCSEASPASFNPQLVNDAPTFNASGIAIYDRLLRYEIGSTKMIPALADSYTISKDGKTYTFNLRKGVKFQTTKNFTPTRDFNAEDVIFSFNRQRLKDHPYHMVGGGNYPSFNSNIKDNIKDITAPTPYQVKIELKEVVAPFLSQLTGQYMSILSSEYADKLARDNKKELIDIEPVGTGPFILQSYTKDNAIKYNRFEQYWDNKNFKGNPQNKIDKLIFSITTDPSVRFQKLKAGECDFVTLPAIADLKAMEENKSIQLLSQEGLNIGYLAMNVTKKPFDNILVRKAIAHALNKKLYLDAIYQNTAVIAKNPIPPALSAYNNSTKDYEYNIDLAKKYLKQAGLENGFETEMWTLPVVRPYNPDGKKMGELMQADLAKIGIKVKLVSFDWPTFLKKARSGEESLIQFGWTGNSDPDTFLNDLLSCASTESGDNTARWCNKDFNNLVVSARQETDPKKRNAAYLKAQKIFKDDVPWVTLAHAKVFRALSKKISGYRIDPFGFDHFEQVEKNE
jgi:dipeptide transport system substrate-binding protein